jgi:acid phosphatase type 7
VRRRLLLLLVCVACGYCGGQAPTGPTSGQPTVPLPPAGFVPPPPIPPGGPHIFVGAGDIGFCDKNAVATAALLDTIGGTVFTLGDNAYFRGTRQEFRDCYDPAWGRHKHRTFPVPGNHEYDSPFAGPYFEYFGEVAGGPEFQGYYSHEVGAWHAVALNSNIPVGPGSAQATWLRNDLASSRARCTVAYWHHPLFTSGPNGDVQAMREFWRLLYEADADLVLVAHEHMYERFAPQDPNGRADPVRGIRQFVAGTGGALLYPITNVHPNSEVRISAFGVLKLTLFSDRYQWEFVPVSGQSDAGSGFCH